MKTTIAAVGIATTYIVISSIIILGFAATTGLVADNNEAAFIVIASVIVLGFAVAAGLFAGDNDSANPYTTAFNEDSTMRTTIAVVGIATAFIVITGIIVLGVAATTGWIAGDNAFADPYTEPSSDKPKEIWVDAKGRKFRCAEFYKTTNQMVGTYTPLGYADADALRMGMNQARVRVELLGLIPPVINQIPANGTPPLAGYELRMYQRSITDTSSLSMAEMEAGLRHCIAGRE